MQFQVTRRARRNPRINMTNLIDIIFNLLIFFVITTTFRTQQPLAVKLELPEAKTAEEVGKEKITRLTIAIAPDETIYLDNKPITRDRLADALRSAKQKNPNVILQLSADKTVPYGTIVTVVDAARLAGIRNVTAFTKKSVK